MESQLVDSSYGKTNVKFLKVKKSPENPSEQKILEAKVQVLLKGDFDFAYTKADNASIVPTDTVKNTILVEAKNTDVWPIERFASHLARHFTSKYGHVESVEIDISQMAWTRLQINGKPHAHSFRLDGPETRNTSLKYSKKTKKLVITSSIKNLTVLKSTGSMFYGYNVCDYTTLQPATDRVLSTDIDASWVYDSKQIKDFADVEAQANKGLFDHAYDNARELTLDLFAHENSASVQATMYNISHKILENVPEVDNVTYVLPNKHYILFNLEWKGIKDNKDLFYPSPDPSGLIKSTVARKGAAKL